MWSLDPLLAFLIVLTVTFLALTIYSIIQQNSILLNIPARLLALKILDTTTSASLFVTLLGALVVRHQFVLGFRPRLGYTSARTVKNLASNPKETWDTWQVKIKNVGLGPAIINHCAYELDLSSSKRTCIKYDDVTKELDKIGLVKGNDYWLEKITSGFTLPTQDDCIVFEIKLEHLSKIKHLEVVFYFQGFLGDKYFRKAFLVPSKI